MRKMLLIVAGLAACAGAMAQGFPNKPIKVVVPSPAGGPPDLILRAILPKLSASLGQPIVIENRGGAGGLVGTAYVAKLPADGYTWLFTTASHVNIPPFNENANYDPDRLEYDKEQLRKHYRNRGYYDFRVSSAVAELSPDKNGFVITYTVFCVLNAGESIGIMFCSLIYHIGFSVTLMSVSSVHTHTHVHKHTHTHVNKHTPMYAYMYINTHTHTHTHTCK